MCHQHVWRPLIYEPSQPYCHSRVETDRSSGTARFPEGKVDLDPRVARVDGHELMVLMRFVEKVDQSPRIDLCAPAYCRG